MRKLNLKLKAISFPVKKLYQFSHVSRGGAFLFWRDEMNKIAYGYCHCGCGEKTKISPKTCTSKGWLKGVPRKYILGHHLGKGANHPRWKNGRSIVKSRKKFYVRILKPDHPRNNGRYVFEHILIAEKVLGRYLPQKAVIHHLDEIGTNNKNNNLIICENESYHKLLHKKGRDLK